MPGCQSESEADQFFSWGGLRKIGFSSMGTLDRGVQPKRIDLTMMLGSASQLLSGLYRTVKEDDAKVGDVPDWQKSGPSTRLV